jgi:polyhydroxyalkanoate synthase
LPVQPDSLGKPSLHAIPMRDRIVPPDSALPLAACFNDAQILRPQLGHVGMVAGARAQVALWDPLKAWLLA